jgi:hypothetical protein
MTRCLLFAALLTSSVLHAEPAPCRAAQYVAAGVSFGASEPIYDGYTVMAALDGGYRVSDTWWAHAAIATGTSVDRFGGHAPNGGHDLVARAGAEVRTCASVLCGFAGMDLGIQRGTFSDVVYMDGMKTFTDAATIATPRVGFDVGGRTLRARVEIDSDVALAVTQNNPAYATPRFGDVIGIELGAGVAYQW